MSPSCYLLLRLVFRLAADLPLAFCSDFQGLRYFFLILAAITESMSALLDRLGLLNGRLQPLQIGVLSPS